MNKAAKTAILVFAACLIAPLSLLVHDFMLDGLKVPYPKEIHLPVWASLFGLFVRLAALAGIMRLAAPRQDAKSRALLAMGAGLTMLMLGETIRVINITSFILASWPYALLDAAPKAIVFFFEASIVAYAALRGTRWPGLLAIIVVVALAGSLVSAPWLTDQIGHWRGAHFGDVSEHYKVPYPPKIKAVIFSTFIEPTTAAFILAGLVWGKLRGGLMGKVALFTLLMLLVRGRVVSLLLFSFWVRQPLPVAFLSEGQFFLETAVLALLVGLAWGLLQGPRVRRSQAGALA